MTACAVCHSDIHFAEGAWGGALPAVYGHEAAGVVESVGAEVTAVAVGDHVVVSLIRSCGSCFHCARGEQVQCETLFDLDRQSPLTDTTGAPVHPAMRTGAFAEQVVVHASQVAVVPPDLPLDVASLLGCGVITGFGAVVNTAEVPAGASVAVIGTGGVGLNAIQGAVAVGAHPIIALDLAASKLAAAHAFGATDTVDSSSGDVVGAVRALTAGRGADFTVVAVGAAPAIELGLQLTRRGGTTVIIGMPASGVLATFDPGGLANDSQRIVGSKMGSTVMARDIPRLVELYRQGTLRLDELISGRYPLEQVNEAMASVVAGEALRNVIVMAP